MAARAPREVGERRAGGEGKSGEQRQRLDGPCCAAKVATKPCAPKPRCMCDMNEKPLTSRDWLASKPREWGLTRSTAP